MPLYFAIQSTLQRFKMGAKEEALRQIGLIKDHMIDKQHFYPYNYFLDLIIKV